MIESFLTFVREMGLTLAVGSSTFALIFYFKAIADNVIDATERSFLHTVYFVLRIGLIILIAVEGLDALFHLSSPSYFTNPDFLFRVTLLAIIVANAALMQVHLMPMRLGPALAGASWYSLFTLSVFTPTELPYFFLFSFYLAFIAVAVIGLSLLRRVTRKR